MKKLVDIIEMVILCSIPLIVFWFSAKEPVVDISSYNMKYTKDKSMLHLADTSEITGLDMIISLFRKNPKVTTIIAKGILKDRATYYGYIDIYLTPDGIQIHTLEDSYYPLGEDLTPGIMKFLLILGLVFSVLYWWLIVSYCRRVLF